MQNDSKLTALIAEYEDAVIFAGNSVRLAERATVVNGELTMEGAHPIPGALRAIKILDQIRRYEPTCEVERDAKLEFLSPSL